MSHVVLIVMENHEYQEVIGAAEASYVNSLAARSVLLTRSYAITHPSLPNYLALVGGSTFGIHSDCTDCAAVGRNLGDQLSAKGVSWKAYMEDLPSACWQGGGSGGYAKKHDPFAYFLRPAGAQSHCDRIVPFTEFGTDLSAGLPSFAWITPNLCHDMHDCSVADGDAWLRQWVPRIIRRLGPGGILILTWDEGITNDGCCVHAAGGHVATIIAGPGARSGIRLATSVDHYSLLKLVEDIWSLRHLGLAGCSCTPAITGWRP